MSIKILKKPFTIEEVHKFAKNWYGTMIKGTVDIVQKKIALGGDYHIESCELLVKHGSKQQNIWGFNIRFEENQNGILEFDSLINIKPAFDNKTHYIENSEIIEKATDIIKSWIKFK